MLDLHELMTLLLSFDKGHVQTDFQLCAIISASSMTHASGC